MRTLLLAVALLLAGSGVAFADGMQQVVNSTTVNPQWTVIVFNDSGGALTSGTVVVWDNDDTEFDRSGYPYVTTTATADVDWVAGVTLNPSCPDQSLCEIVVYGMARTNIADATDSVTEDTTVATTTVAGQAGDWDGGANECYLGLLVEAYNLDGGADTNTDLSPMWVFVNPGCED